MMSMLASGKPWKEEPMGKWLERARQMQRAPHANSDNSADSSAKHPTSELPAPIVPISRGQETPIAASPAKGGETTPGLSTAIDANVQPSSRPDHDAQTWREHLGARVAIIEHAGLPRVEAECLALIHCRLDWFNQHPPADPGEGLCVHCCTSLAGTTRTITTSAGVRNLHAACEDHYATARDRIATEARAAFGIGPAPHS